MFSPGQEVLCVKVSDHRRWEEVREFVPHRPRKGRKYVVRDVEDGFIWSDGQPEQLVRLVEVVNPRCAWHTTPGPRIMEMGFPCTWFAPIKRTETDISIFTALLNPANHKVLEDA